jgi:uncharacterized protein YggE
VNVEETNGQEPALTPPGDPLTPTPASGAARTGGRSFRARALAVTGVGALIVAGSIIGASALTSSGSSRGSTNLKTVLTSSHSAAAATGATITVTGTGQVEGTPDTATFDVGVVTTSKSAVIALDDNNTKVAALEASLEQNGVLAKKIQTSSLNLSANTDSDGNVTGFTADDELTVTMTNLSDLGQALDAAVHAAGDGAVLDGISFSISNQSALLAAARAQAMQAAATQASQLAAGAGLAVSSVVKVTDQENAGQQVYFAPVNVAASSSGTPVPVEAGQQQISVQVTVVYQLVAVSS